MALSGTMALHWPARRGHAIHVGPGPEGSPLSGSAVHRGATIWFAKRGRASSPGGSWALRSPSSASSRGTCSGGREQFQRQINPMTEGPRGGLFLSLRLVEEHSLHILLLQSYLAAHVSARGPPGLLTLEESRVLRRDGNMRSI
eukprot:210728-Alexandrium_andersonii.AAC.1